MGPPRPPRQLPAWLSELSDYERQQYLARMEKDYPTLTAEQHAEEEAKLVEMRQQLQALDNQIEKKATTSLQPLLQQRAQMAVELRMQFQVVHGPRKYPFSASRWKNTIVVRKKL